MREHYFDNFRALVILMIVFRHSYNDNAVDEFFEILIANALDGGSSLFVFVSGYFFYRVFYNNFSYKQFLTKKAKFILTPYIFLSVSYMSLSLALGNSLTFVDDIVYGNQIYVFIANILSGRTLFTYWYIPFICLVFILSPLYIKFIELGVMLKVFIILSLYSLAFFINRPMYNLNPFHSLIYYTPFYMLGIVCAQYHKEIFGFVQDKIIYFLIIWVGTLLGMNYSGQIGNVHRFIFDEVIYFDMMIFQKIFFIAVILTLFKLFLDKRISCLKFIAETSFAIYFLHAWVILLAKKINIFDSFSGLGGALLIGSLATGISISVAVLLKRVLRDKSRYLTGY